jgi:tRNA(Ile)-lysidine synthase
MADARRVSTAPAPTSVRAELGRRVVGLDDIDGSVVVACSGGPDSLALLALTVDREVTVTAVHVDHGMRAESDAEAEVVATAADRLGAAFRAEAETVAQGPNLEERARTARYAALERSRLAIGAAVTLVGHTADDQAETVVLHLLRGSAAAGLGGMAVRRDTIVRPLLGIRRAETEALCAELGLDPVRDPTNDDRAFRRNWVRHEVLPMLSRGSERDLVPVLARQAGILRSESDYLDALARAAWPPDAHDDRPPAEPLARLPVVLARRAVRQWLGPPPPSHDEVERVLAVARHEARATELGGGRRVSRRRGRLERSQ